MALAVETPPQPDLTNRPIPSDIDESAGSDTTVDLRRSELEDILQDGAWNEAFQEWATYTDLTGEEYRTVLESGLVQRLDFYWDPDEERLRYEVPELPDLLTEDRVFASKIATELSDLSRAVTEMIEDAYIDWGEGDEADDAWIEGAFDEETSSEE